MPAMDFSFLGPTIEFREAFWLVLFFGWPIALVWALWAQKRRRGNRDGAALPLDEVR